MPAKQIVTDAQVKAAYRKAGSAKGAGEILGIHGSSVHQRLVKLGINKSINRWSDADDRLLRTFFVEYREQGNLHVLCAKLKRNLPAVRARASSLGLTFPRGYKKPRTGKWKYMTEASARKLFERFKKSSHGIKRFCKLNGLASENFASTMRRFFPDEFDIATEAKAPRQSMYRLGRALEYRILNEARGLGYFAMRSPASKSGIDVVCIRTGCVLFIQSKRGGYVGPKEWNVLFDLAQSVGAVPIIASLAAGGKGTEYRRMVARKQPWARGLRKQAEPSIPFTLSD